MCRKVLGCVTLLVTARVSFAQVLIETEMDWGTGRLEILVSQSLDLDTLPRTHPRALAALERKLPALLAEDIGNLPWDRFGTLEEHIGRKPSLADTIERFTEFLSREWSRISEDGKAIEAFYSLDLTALLPSFFPGMGKLGLPEVPIGWIPIPEDDWTGIVIYAPEDMLIWGTGISSSLHPALYARILSEDFAVLFDPAESGNSFLSYHSVENRDEVDALVGRRAYRTMARGLYGEFPCDIVLSNEDARRILAANSGREALLGGKVVILLDSLPR